jgi:putative membrane protein
MYELVKALHIIAVVSWVAGLLYLPRLFVYHCEAERGSHMDVTFQLMERRLYRFIMGPAMAATWLFGLGLISFIGFAHGWLHLKLLLVVMLTASHFYFGHCMRTFAQGQNKHSKKFFKLINEIPTLLMIGIVLLAVMKPF